MPSPPMIMINMVMIGMTSTTIMATMMAVETMKVKIGTIRLIAVAAQPPKRL